MAKEYLIGDILKRIKRPVLLQDDREYKLVTIKLNHKGVVLREIKSGSEIKSNMYEVKQGDFILSGIDARNGAFGIVPLELDGAIVTNDFWYFQLNEVVVSKSLFLELTATTWFDEICKRGSDGTTQRIRLQKDKFFNQTVILPRREEQEEILNRLSVVKSKRSNLLHEIDHQKKLLFNLKQAILREAIEGNLTSKWRDQTPNLESGWELVKRIRAKEQQRTKEHEIKKERIPPLTSKQEFPFSLPDGWGACKLGEAITLISGQDFDKSLFSEKSDEGIPYLTGASNLREGRVILNRWTKHGNSIARYGDLLLTCKGSGVGKMAFMSIESAHIARQLMAIRSDLVDVHFIKIVLESNLENFQKSAKSLIPGVDRKFVLNIPLPLPSLEEQKVIVQKVNSLQEKVQGLEAEIIQSGHYGEMLVQAALKEAFSSSAQSTPELKLDKSDKAQITCLPI